jgi:glycosyltransferase involved in cell wall biosynthesis
MLVRDRISDDPEVVAVSIEPAALRLAREIESRWIASERSELTDTFFSASLDGIDLSGHPTVRGADLLHLHWIPGLLDVPAIGALLAGETPVVWTLHDEWPFTGGCHYTAGCDRWRARCEACPQLRRDPLGLVPAQFREKRKSLDRGRPVVVAPSRWLADRARSSALLSGLETEVIPYAVDLEAFRPELREAGRKDLSLGTEEPLLVFSAESTRERRKGFDHLLEALGRLDVGVPRPRLGVVGESDDVSLPSGSIRFGRLADRRRVAAIVAAADLVAIPSLEDNLPNAALESLASGTPVVAYATGGLPEALAGAPGCRLAPTGDCEGLAAIIGESLRELDRLRSLRAEIRRFAIERFAPSRLADAHRRLYARILENAGSMR